MKYIVYIDIKDVQTLILVIQVCLLLVLLHRYHLS